MKIKKTLCTILTIALILSSAAVSVSAKSIAECFTSGSGLVSKPSFPFIDIYKYSWGQTEGFDGKHTIRCYIGTDRRGDSGSVMSVYPHRKHYVRSKDVYMGDKLAGTTNSYYPWNRAYARYNVV